MHVVLELLGQSTPEPHLWTFAHIIEALLSLGIGTALYTLLLRIGVFGIDHPHAEVPERRHLVSYISVDNLYTSLAHGVVALCVKLDNIQNKSLSVSIQMVISFLVLILFISFIL